MIQSAKSSFLEEAVGLLVQHFGEERVRAALASVSTGDAAEQQGSLRRTVARTRGPSGPTVSSALELLRERDPVKHRLLSEFLSHLKERTILPESQDIRHFAHLVGLKEIAGKSRKDMIPALMRFLLEQPSEQLQIDLQNAQGISEQQRQQGFSVLTDKLLSGT